MPGFILHLTAAQMLQSHLHEYPDFPYPIQSVNDFLVGNLLPDATDQKELSHFRNPVYRDKMIQQNQKMPLTSVTQLIMKK